MMMMMTMMTMMMMMMIIIIITIIVIVIIVITTIIIVITMSTSGDCCFDYVRFVSKDLDWFMSIYIAAFVDGWSSIMLLLYLLPNRSSLDVILAQQSMERFLFVGKELVWFRTSRIGFK